MIKRLARNRRVLIPMAMAVAIIALVSTYKTGSAENIKAEPGRQATRNTLALRHAGNGDLDLNRLRRETGGIENINVFESVSWYVPPPLPPAPPPAMPLPPAPPQAPPLPFTFLGRYQDSAKPLFFLLQGDIILTVSAGETLDGNYRVEGLDGPSLIFTYIPLGIKQSIHIGEAG
jgi:hypothetical protein